jgi:hypothetical protein
MAVLGAYTLRGFDRSNLAEIELFNLMGYHPVTLKARGCWKKGFKYSTEADLTSLENLPSENNHVISRITEDVLFTVADHSDKIVGWIWFYQDSSHPLPSRISTELGLTPRNSRIYQISYEKLMSDGWPDELVKQVKHVTVSYLAKERKGVIVQGLKLAISRLSRMYRKLYVYKRKLVLYAFVHRLNLASAKVLKYNGFVRMTRKYSYDGTLHYLWVKVV